MTKADKRARDAARRRTLKSIKAKRDIRIKQINDEAKQKIRELAIEYSKNPERLKAKYAAADYAKNEKEKRRAAELIEKEKKYLEEENSLRAFTLGERIFSAISQGIGACAQIALLVLFLVFKSRELEGMQKTANFALYSCFSAAVICAFIFSLLHYALENLSAKEVFKRLSHASLFLSLALFYTLFAFRFFWTNEKAAIIFLSVIHALCLLAVVLYSVFSSRIERLCTVLFVLLGLPLLFFSLSGVLKSKIPPSLLFAQVGYAVSLLLSSFRKIKYAFSFSHLILVISTALLSMSFFRF